MTGHREPLCDTAEMRDQDERDATLLLPRDRRDRAPPHESAVRPYAVAVEPPRDARAEREGVTVVDKHHHLAEQLTRRTSEDEYLDRHQDTKDGAERKRETVIRRLRVFPHKQRGGLAKTEPQQVCDDLHVGGEEANPEQEQHL